MVWRKFGVWQARAEKPEGECLCGLASKWRLPRRNYYYQSFESGGGKRESDHGLEYILGAAIGIAL